MVKMSVKNCSDVKAGTMHLPLCTGDQNCNEFLCPVESSSSDSARSVSSEGSVASPLDVEMPECGTEEGSPAEGFPTSHQVSNPGFDSTALQTPGGWCGKGVGVSEPGVKRILDKRGASSQRLNLVISGLPERNGGGGGGGSSTDLSPDSSPCSSETGRTSATSLSSCDMVMRRNSFSRSDSDRPLSVSLVRESARFLSDSSQSAPLLGTLPDVCEGLPEKKQTFIIGEDLVARASQDGELIQGAVEFPDPKRLPQEMDASGGRGSQSAGDEPPCVEGETVSVEGVCSSSAPGDGTFLLFASEDFGSACNAQTSTPVQGSGNRTFCVSSFSESPSQLSRGELGSPAVLSERKQRRKPVAKPPSGAKMAASATNKPSRADIQRFPRPGIKNAKSAVLSGPVNALRIVSSGRVKAASAKPASGPESIPLAAQGRGGPAGAKRRRSASSQSKAVIPESGGVSDEVLAPRAKSSREAKTGAREGQRAAAAGGGSTSSGGSLTSETASRVWRPPKKCHPGETAPREDRSASRQSSVREAGMERGQNGGAVAVSSKPAASDGSKPRLGPRPSPHRAGLRPPPSTPRAKSGVSGKDGRSAGSGSPPRGHPGPVTGIPKVRLTERTGAAVTHPTAVRPPSGGPGGLRPAATSKLPLKAQPRSPSSLSQSSCPGAAPAVCLTEDPSSRPTTLGRAPPSKGGVERNRTTSLSGRSGTTGCKTVAVPHQNPLKPVARVARLTGTAKVDKTKPRPGPTTQQAQPKGPPDLVPTGSKPPSAGFYRAQCDRKEELIRQLRSLQASGNQRVEALAVVVQHVSKEREEAARRQKELSHELANLRQELVSSAGSFEKLREEKDEQRAAFEGVLQRLQEQHRTSMTDLEERLKAFYSAEWEKLYQTYQQEADQCRDQMERQMNDLRSEREAQRTELEAVHNSRMDALKQQYETSFQELRHVHEKEIETLNQALLETKATLAEQVNGLMTENHALNEKLKAEEERRRMLVRKNQKDSHTLYLEQELESLKVVLDIKNKQLHQQDKKLMQMDKLVESNLKQEEHLKKVLQENEDFRVRMDKHAALSKQLSTEQAALQQTLQKESKVNKRLSMENEELLWKLQNGDLTSPRKLSPSSPFQSPPDPGAFPGTPVSPR